MNLNFITKTTNSAANVSGFEVSFDDFEIRNTDSVTNPEYACISYAWGEDFMPHPYDKSINISKRTLSVLTAALNACHSLQENGQKYFPMIDKFWIDSLCVPGLGVEWDQQIFLTGEIFKKAALLIVVLSNEFSQVLEKVKKGIPFNVDDFEIINNDPWVSRYSTYQEIIIFRKIYFISEAKGSAEVHASELFDKLAQEFDVFCQSQNLKTLEAQKKYPHVCALEPVILDERIQQEYRSIYQVMVNMEYRKSSNDDSKLRSLCSFLATSENLDVIHFENELTEFYERCKRTNDYSFIFNTSTDRSQKKQKWLPVGYDFKPIYPWLYCYGEKQYGELTNDHLLLKDMLLLDQGPTLQGVNGSLKMILKYNVDVQENEVLEILQGNLKGLNFEGCYEPVELPLGYYFDQNDNYFQEDHIIAICYSVKWMFGAPAIKLAKRETSDIYDFISSGVFFGDMREKNIILQSIKVD